MCGVVGFSGPPDRDLLGRMASAVRHRGPDGAGALESPLMSLGHRRLGIIDRAGGRQPMANEDGTVWAACNGEIYNFRELRTELESLGHAFQTACDSEVVVHAYEEWGPRCAGRFNGMWAFAVADLRPGRERLVLNRDHFGIKPLFYARSPESGRLLFASEIKALLQDPQLGPEPDDQMIAEYLTRGLHDHREATFFRGVHHVPAGTWIEVPLVPGPRSPGLLDEPLEAHRYWTPQLTRSGGADPDDFRRRFREAVRMRLVSEVPVGSCLSGGLDSSAIVGFMGELMREEDPDAASLGGRLKTFSAVFDGDPIDERAYIEVAVASSGADTTYNRPAADGFIDEVRDWVWHQEEPTVSTGPYAQWCTMRSARQQVTVVLDGQGGDELLAGYPPYQMVYLRQLLRDHRYGHLATEAFRSADVLWPLVRRRLSQRRRAVPMGQLLRPEFLGRTRLPPYGRSRDDLKLRLLQDTQTYSLPCVLRYEDRNSMAFSIESRVPYLDQGLVDHILALPDDAIIHDGWSRWIVREGLRGALPEKIRRRRWKVGFTTPEMRWIKALRAVFHSLYGSPPFQSRPYWDGQAVAAAFRACCRGEVEESMLFWRTAHVELWLREFVDHDVVLHETDIEAALSEPAPVGPVHRGSIAAAGDDLVPALLAAGAGPARRDAAGDDPDSPQRRAAQLVATYHPNPAKHLFGTVSGTVWARLPLATPLLDSPTSLERLASVAAPHACVGDVVVVANAVVPDAEEAPRLVQALADQLRASAGGRVGVAVVSATDDVVTVVAATSGLDPDQLAALLVDNPMGQRDGTPLAVLRRIGELSPESVAGPPSPLHRSLRSPHHQLP